MTTTKQNIFDITIMKFDDKTTPYPSATQQGLIDELFDQSQPLEDKVNEIQTLTRTASASTSNNQTNANNANDETDTTTTIPSVDNSSIDGDGVDGSYDKSESVDKHNNLTIQKKVVHTPTSDVKKRGRPRKLPTPVISSKNSLFSLKKDSICYLKLYSQNLTREDLQTYLSLNPKMTIAEEVAVDLLTGVINKNPKDIDRYWQIVQKAQKTVETQIPAQSTGNNTLMDNILTEVEGVVFGEVVDESETAC